MKKTKETNIDRYGVESPMQVPEIKEKWFKTHKENTGYDNPSQNPEVKEKKIEKFMKQYVVGYYLE